MATLSAKQRTSLPDSAFAYIDSKGNRRLPIHDEAHVRAALSRFNQVKYESPEAKERAFRRLLKAAAEYGIAPVGFVTRQLREAAAGQASTALPSGQVTLMLTDIEGSTRLVRELGDDYPVLLEEVRALIRGVIEDHHGYEVDSRGDEFFAAFGTAQEAVRAGISLQKAMAATRWPEGREVKVRIGIHSGSPALTDAGYVGLPVHVMARVATAGHGGQILISAATRQELGDGHDFELISLGRFELQGLAEAEELIQVGDPQLPASFPPPRAAPEG